MTNKEKALELENKLSHKVSSLHYGYTIETLLEMAEWKDQQYADIIKEECNISYESGFAEGERTAEARFKEYLEKKVQEINPNIWENGNLNKALSACRKGAIKEIINELFNDEYRNEDTSDNDE